MAIRAFRREDAPGLAALSREAARGQNDFVLNPLWEGEDELMAEFARFGIDPEGHLRVAAEEDEAVQGLSGVLRRPDQDLGGLLCPIVGREQRGRGLGGALLRAGLALAADELGIRLLTAAVGTRNRAGYSLLASHGFRPVRQHFLMRCDGKPQAAALPELEKDGLALRAAGPDDADAILDLYQRCGFEPRSAAAMRGALDDGGHAHAVAHLAGDLAAFVELETHWPRRVWVAYVGVAPELRDRGIGSALAGWALAQRFEGETRCALLLLSMANRSALRAYEKVGFRLHRVVDVLEKPL